MLKRINVQHVTLGMFLHEFCGSWMEHPFWRTRFLLNSEADLQRLRATSIKEVWIDVRKGLDVGVQVPCLRFDPQDELRHQIPDNARPVSEQSTAPISTATELRRAAQTCAQARQLLSRLFNDARLGRPVDATAAGQLVDDVTASVARNPHALIGLARLKTADDYTYMHSLAVCALMVAMPSAWAWTTTACARPAWPASCMTWARPRSPSPCSTSPARWTMRSGP
jgi:HD-GYP domain-containing protein (c-di-GMP phosphodiesterase class II)